MSMFVLVLLMPGPWWTPPPQQRFDFPSYEACQREARRWIEADRLRNRAFCIDRREARNAR